MVTGSISLLVFSTGDDDDIIDVLRASTASNVVISNGFSSETAEHLTHQQNIQNLYVIKCDLKWKKTVTLQIKPKAW